MKTRLPDSLFSSKKGDCTVASKRYREILEKIPETGQPPSVFVKSVMDGFSEIFEGNEQSRKSVVGAVFEFAVAECLRIKKLPFYTQVTLTNIPMAKFDFVLFNPKVPVVFSVKVSLAERWKQAAFEGEALKGIYKQGLSYLITQHKNHAKNMQAKIDAGVTSGIDKCIVADSDEYDGLLKRLVDSHSGKHPFEKAGPINPIASGRFVP